MRGDWKNNLYLTYEDLLPLLKFLGYTSDEGCRLKYISLDGNRILDNGCKVISMSLKTNNSLQLISIEENKCTFKGFKLLILSIIESEKNIKLCDIPLHSLLDDKNFKNKIKKLSDKIQKVIEIIRNNRNKFEEIEENNLLNDSDDDQLAIAVPEGSQYPVDEIQPPPPRPVGGVAIIPGPPLLAYHSLNLYYNFIFLVTKHTKWQTRATASVCSVYSTNNCTFFSDIRYRLNMLQTQGLQTNHE